MNTKVITIISFFILNSIIANCQNGGAIYIIGDPGYRVFLDKDFKGNTQLDYDGLYIDNLDSGKYIIQIKKGTNVVQTEIVFLNTNEVKEIEIIDDNIQEINIHTKGFYIGNYDRKGHSIEPVDPRQLFLNKEQKEQGAYIYLNFNHGGTGKWGIIANAVEDKGKRRKRVARLLTKSRLSRKINEVLDPNFFWDYSSKNSVKIEGGDYRMKIEGEFKFVNNNDLIGSDMTISIGDQLDKKIVFFEFVPF